MSATDSKATPKTTRRRRASVGGFQTRLDAPQKPGMVMRWVNDVPGRIAKMQSEMAYDFAERETRTDGEGSRIARFAGTGPNGEPIMAYLMETPVEEYEVGVKEKEERLKPFEEAINRGEDTTGRVEDSYKPKSGRSNINNSSG
jgi:hypothetical protein